MRILVFDHLEIHYDWRNAVGKRCKRIPELSDILGSSIGGFTELDTVTYK